MFSRGPYPGVPWGSIPFNRYVEVPPEGLSIEEAIEKFGRGLEWLVETGQIKSGRITDYALVAPGLIHIDATAVMNPRVDFILYHVAVGTKVEPHS